MPYRMLLELNKAKIMPGNHPRRDSNTSITSSQPARYRLHQLLFGGREAVHPGLTATTLEEDGDRREEEGQDPEPAAVQGGVLAADVSERTRSRSRTGLTVMNE